MKKISKISKLSKLILIFILAVTLSFTIFACGKTSDKDAIAKIPALQTTATIEQKINLPKKSEDRDIVWTVDKTEYAKVENNALVVIKESIENDVVIKLTATIGKEAKVYTITIPKKVVQLTDEDLVKKLPEKLTSATIASGTTINLEAKVEGKDVVWTVDNTEYAKVENNVLTILKAGTEDVTVKVTAKIGQAHRDYTLTIPKQEVQVIDEESLQKLSAELTSAAIEEGLTVNLQAKVDEKDITWTVDQAEYAKVENNVLTILKASTTEDVTVKVTAKIGEATREYSLVIPKKVVQPTDEESLQKLPAELTSTALAINSTVDLQAKVDEKDITWTVDQAEYAKVENNVLTILKDSYKNDVVVKVTATIGVATREYSLTIPKYVVPEELNLTGICPAGAPLLSIAGVEKTFTSPDGLEVVNGPSLLGPALQKGEKDVVVISIVGAMKLYNKDKAAFKYEMIATISLNNFYIVSRKDISTATIDQITGKVFSFGENETPGALTKALFKDRNDITYDWSNNVAEIVGKFEATEATSEDYYIIAEPLLTKAVLSSKKASKPIFYRALTDYLLDEAKDVLLAGLFIRKDLDHKAAFADELIRRVSANVEEAKANPAEYVQKAVDLGRVAEKQKGLFTNALPRAGIACEDVRVKENMDKITAFHTFLKNAGALPEVADQGFFFSE